MKEQPEERQRITVDSTAMTKQANKRELTADETITADGFIRDREVEPARYPESEVRQFIDSFLTPKHSVRF